MNTFDTKGWVDPAWSLVNVDLRQRATTQDRLTNYDVSLVSSDAAHFFMRSNHPLLYDTTVQWSDSQQYCTR